MKEKSLENKRYIKDKNKLKINSAYFFCEMLLTAQRCTLILKTNYIK